MATQLDAAGHIVEVLSPDPLALTRFTRHVRRVHRVPAYGTDPLSWLDAAISVYQAGECDVLLPTQEQVAVLSACQRRVADTGISTAVPSFDALVAVQDKVSAHGTLARLGLAQPVTKIVASSAELGACDLWPAYVKTPIGTATTGVSFVDDATEAAALASRWDATGVFGGGPVLVQVRCDGPLVMIQTVFDEGELVASHVNVRVREDARGGASHKRSVDLRAFATTWRVSAPTCVGTARCPPMQSSPTPGPVYIDINPRLVEPANAWRSGVDLVSALLDVARDKPQPPQPPGREGVTTHQLLLAVLGAAQHEQTRRAVARELLDAVLHRGSYRASVEELTPIRRDLRTILPVAAATIATLVHPNTWRWFSAGAVSNYALTPQAWRAIREQARPA